MNATNRTAHVVFAGGGTGGHLFPGLAVAEHLSQRLPALRITFAGSGKPLERRHVAEAGFDYLQLPCRPTPRNLRDVFAFLCSHLSGRRAALRFARRENVTLVVGLGGYASVPMARAAVREAIPMVLLEQNAVPGRATRWLAGAAHCVCLAMDEARTRLPHDTPGLVTGNPLRAGFAQQRSSSGRRDWQSRTLVVLGGSAGARALNQAVPAAIAKVRRSLSGWKIVHQSGEADLQDTAGRYEESGVDAEVVPFVSDMPRLLRRAELAVCRCGATTLAELAAMRVPAIAVPYPHAADDHQRTNADVFTAAGGCLTLDERDLTGPLENHLADVLRCLLEEPDVRRSMAQAMGRLAQPNATQQVSAVLERLLPVQPQAATNSGARTAA